jgi:hypothetical protein
MVMLMNLAVRANVQRAVVRDGPTDEARLFLEVTKSLGR